MRRINMHMDRVLKVRFWNTDKALDLAMKYCGMFEPREDEEHLDELVELLKSARRRADSVTAKAVDVTPGKKRLRGGNDEA